MSKFSGYEGSVVFVNQPGRAWIATVTEWEYEDRRINNVIRRMGQQTMAPANSDRVLGGQDWTGRIEFLGDTAFVAADYGLQASVEVTVRLVMLIPATGAPYVFEAPAWLTDIRGRSPIDGPDTFEANMGARNGAIVFKRTA